MAKTIELPSRRVLMCKKYSCERESVRLHWNAWDTVNVWDLRALLISPSWTIETLNIVTHIVPQQLTLSAPNTPHDKLFRMQFPCKQVGGVLILVWDQLLYIRIKQLILCG